MNSVDTDSIYDFLDEPDERTGSFPEDDLETDLSPSPDDILYNNLY